LCLVKCNIIIDIVIKKIDLRRLNKITGLFKYISRKNDKSFLAYLPSEMVTDMDGRVKEGYFKNRNELVKIAVIKELMSLEDEKKGECENDK
jgi:hypothetical protein